MSLNLEIPVKTRCASCNCSIESKQTRIEKHFESSGTANENALREQDTDLPLTKATISLPRRRTTLKRMNSVHQVEIKPSAREKMLSFSEELKRRQSKNQNKVTQDTNNEMKSTSDYVEDPKENLINGDIEKESSKGDIEENPLSKDAETLCTNEEEDPVDEKSSSCSESRPVISEVTQTWQGKEWNLWKTVTNIHPPHDTQVPDGPTNIDEECGNIEQNTKAPQRLRLFSKNLFDTIQQKLALKKIRLPPLCPCGHDTSVFDVSYSDKCCVNCQLYKDKKQHERLLRTMLKSFKLL